jgi:hypothetical protein
MSQTILNLVMGAAAYLAAAALAALAYSLFVARPARREDERRARALRAYMRENNQ